VLLETVLTPYWASFLKDVLWKTFRRAIVYAITLAVFAVLLAAFMVKTLVEPLDDLSVLQFIELGVLVVAYVAGGLVCGFLAGVTSIRREMTRLTDAIYEVLRAMVEAAASRSGQIVDPIPIGQLRTFLEVDAGGWLKAFSRKFGVAGRLFLWIARGPVEHVQLAVTRDLLPTFKGNAVPISAIEQFAKPSLMKLGGDFLRKQINMIEYQALGLGIAALVIPVLLVKWS
jgi:hypothetical protein